MSDMTSIVLPIFGVLFVAFAIYGKLKFTHLTLATVVSLPGEVVLFEDENARWTYLPYNNAVFNSFWFQRAVVRVTNRRLLIAQPALFSPRTRVIRFAVFTSPIPVELGSALKDGYLTFSTRPDLLSVTEVKGRRVLKIAPTEPGPPAPQYVLIDSPRIDQYLSVVGAPTALTSPPSAGPAAA